MIGSNKERGSTAAGGSQSWRQLAGNSRVRVNSHQASQRRLLKWLKLFVLLLILVLIISVVVWVGTRINDSDHSLQVQAPSQPVQRVLFYSDGVLPNSWVSSILNLAVGVSMMEVDIFALKQQIESNGQIKSATVERIFPGDLKIVVQEHAPTLRMAIQYDSGEKLVRIVARDGSVYDGVGYKNSTLQRLPYLLPYQHLDGSYFPLKGIARVAELLEYARNNYPKIFASWQVIALTHYSGDIELPGQVIEARSPLVPRIIFSANQDYGKQLDRLKYIMEYIKQRGNQSIERIDLSLSDSAAVQFSSGRVGSY